MEIIVVGRSTGVSVDLFENALTSLPTEIDNLTGLTAPDLVNNQLTALPPEMKKLVDRGVVKLSGNPLRCWQRNGIEY